MAKKNIKNEVPKKKRPISLNILEIAKRLQKIEEITATPYTLPTASADTKGGVKVGNGLSMTGEVLSADAVDASHVSYDNTDSGMTATDVQGAVDELTDEIGLKIKYFDISVPAGSSDYDFSNDKPSDYKRILSAMSVSGGGAIIRQTGPSVIYFYEALTSASAIRVLYIAD